MTGPIRSSELACSSWMRAPCGRRRRAGACGSRRPRGRAPARGSARARPRRGGCARWRASGAPSRASQVLRGVAERLAQAAEVGLAQGEGLAGLVEGLREAVSSAWRAGRCGDAPTSASREVTMAAAALPAPMAASVRSSSSFWMRPFSSSTERLRRSTVPRIAVARSRTRATRTLRSVTTDCWPSTRSRHSAASISACSSADWPSSRAARPASSLARAASCSPPACSRASIISSSSRSTTHAALVGGADLVLGAAQVFLGGDQGELALVGLGAGAVERGAHLGHPQAEGLLRLEQGGRPPRSSSPPTRAARASRASARSSRPRPRRRSRR